MKKSVFSCLQSTEHLARFVDRTVDAEGGSVREEVFVARCISVGELVVTESSLLVAELAEIAGIAHMLMPSTRFVMKAFGVPGF